MKPLDSCLVIFVATASCLASARPLRASDAVTATELAATQPTTAAADDKPLALEMNPASKPSGPSPGFIIWPEPGFLIWPQPAPLEGTIATDRPGFADTTSVVPRGHIQLESGYSYTYDNGPGHNRLQVQDFPELSLRIGVLSDLEVRVGWTGEYITRTRYLAKTRAGRTTTFLDKAQGGSDMKVGVKWAMTRQEGLMPNLSLIPSLYLPTGADGFSTGDVDPEIRIAYSWLALERLTIYGVVQMSSISYEDDHSRRFFQTGASVAGSYQITDKLAGIVEYFFVAPLTAGSDAAHTINICSTYLITDNVQFDIRVGFGLNEEAPDFSTSAGISFRF